MGVFNQAKDDADGDEGEHGVEALEQTQGAGLLGGGEVAAEFTLEAGSEVDEDEDEELLEADAAHVDVDAAVGLRLGDIVA